LGDFIGSILVVIGVSQTYWNRGVRSHRKGAKKIWIVYSIDEDGKLHTTRVNAWEALLCKTQIKRKRKAYCATCNRDFVGFFKNDKEILKTECPDCEDSDITLIPQDSFEYVEKLLQGLQSD